MGDAERLDADRLEVLRRWGEGLGQDSRDEVRAAGKAIVLLVDEVERLHVEVWHTRTAASTPPEPRPTPLWTTLVARLRRGDAGQGEFSTGHPQAEEDLRRLGS